MKFSIIFVAFDISLRIIIGVCLIFVRGFNRQRTLLGTVSKSITERS